jgi:hypothetical protein
MEKLVNAPLKTVKIDKIVLPRAKVYRHLAPKGTGMKIREIL